MNEKTILIESDAEVMVVPAEDEIFELDELVYVRNTGDGLVYKTGDFLIGKVTGVYTSKTTGHKILKIKLSGD